MRLQRSIIRLVIIVVVLMCFAPAARSQVSPARDRGLRIYRLYPNEFKDELLIYGRFGSRPGEVLMNDKPLKLDHSWAETMLVCALPRFGAQAAGNVTVQVGALKSNTVQLTEWREEFGMVRRVSLLDFTGWMGGTLGLYVNQGARIKLHFRADLHRGEPSEPEVTSAEPLAMMRPAFPKGVLFVAAKDSTCTLLANGEGTFKTPRGDDKMTFPIKDPPGPAVKLWDDYPGAAGEGETASAGTSSQRAAERGFIVLGSIDVEARKLYLDLHVEAPEGGKIVHSLPPTARNVNDTYPIHFQTNDFIRLLDPDVDTVVVALENRFRIKADWIQGPVPNVPRSVKELTPDSQPAILGWGVWAERIFQFGN